jgi:hypothetical protein
MTQKNSDSRCKAYAKSGKPCRAAATNGGLCFFHANPNKASELGRIGGRSKHRAAAENTDPLPTLNNAIAVRDTVARLIVDVYSGKRHPKIAAGLAPFSICSCARLRLRIWNGESESWRSCWMQRKQRGCGCQFQRQLARESQNRGWRRAKPFSGY